MADVIRLHPDWPEAELVEIGEYDTYYVLPTPLADLGHALAGAYAQRTAAPIPAPVAEPVRLHHLAEVTRYYVQYHGDVWTPGNAGGTELQLMVIARTTDGRWVAVEAWNDFTGCGCHDESDVRIGDTEEQVVRYGLTNDARARLGYPAVAVGRAS